MSGVGTTAVVAVAFTAFGVGPVWADDVPDPRPGPPIEQRSSAAPAPVPSTPSPVARPGDSVGATPSVADVAHLTGDVEVAPLEETRSAEFFVVTPESLPADVVSEIGELDGVEATEVVDAAQVTIDGAAASVLGVDPSEFRAFAPEPSAESDEIWQGIAEGNLALSHDLGQDSDLEVDTEVTIEGAYSAVTKRVWTHATSGITGIDILASREVTQELGFPDGNGLIVSAPEADLDELREALEKALGSDAGVQLLAEDPDPRPATAAGDPVDRGTLEDMIEEAEKYLGVPYVWGGDDPSGFDCSGLVQWAFAQNDVTVPRVAADQWGAGERIEYEDAERGDLLFWRSDPTAPNRISHVAIYLGDDQMLEAPRTGSVVKYSDVRFANMAGVVRVTA
ncbi:C40 family peptidase [Spiractinospora alimapuensis]|uniref:C40 family peptidase n=1 Tax=Spiractinospora alimapuensis TaxID=2820884 RepID=UPI001F34616F|nr:C40 family peptidase [Spiractinospora alimapuensis]QVQ53739.1 C40 family peptidase [Spiractinospora alimapuensis]